MEHDNDTHARARCGCHSNARACACIYSMILPGISMRHAAYIDTAHATYISLFEGGRPASGAVPCSSPNKWSLCRRPTARAASLAQLTTPERAGAWEVGASNPLPARCGESAQSDHALRQQCGVHTKSCESHELFRTTEKSPSSEAGGSTFTCLAALSVSIHSTPFG